jgi:putative hydrolase of the HAD superfamily
MTPVQAVLFDYGMVLSGPPLPAAWTRMRSITGLDEPTLHREYWAHRHDYDRGTLSGTAYWQELARGGKIELSAAQVDDLIAADTDLWGELNLPMVHWAQSLQHSGMRTGILSNIGDAMSTGLLAKFEWLGAFDHCIWSHQLKLAKPEAAIYQHAAEGLRTPPANILFIDDRIENIQAALAAGMQAIQYLDHANFEQQMHDRGLSQLLHSTEVFSKS